MTTREDAVNPGSLGTPTTAGTTGIKGGSGPPPSTLDGPNVRPIVEQFHAHTRYVIDGVLGEGGMGIVFRATDPELRRTVALKVIKEGSTEQKVRFMREAQAQARIAHDSICKVYEVGEVHGYRFIAMQYISGWTLCDARERLTLEEKISVMQRIAEALHEAHRLGLIHRDIKPGNIMVEQTEDGAWRPYLLDFGVLRDMEGPAVTRTGIAVGTPQYMAPEQILGHIQKLDRRTDVYGLGATFYDLLGGAPPFHGETSTDLLLKALNDDPAPLQKIEPSTPLDIDHIIMKCIEKEPQRRYESAKALSEDLQRYIAGDPVQARGTTWRYRTLKRIRKHKMVAIPVAIAIVIIVALVGVGIRMQFQARHREVLARQLGQDLEEIDNIMRSAYMMPPHDIRREKKMVQDRIREIEARMRESGRAGQAVGNFALGRAYRILEDYEKAVAYLHTAWDGGYREPEASYELGLVMGHLYQEEIATLRGITDQSVRESRLKQAAQKYRDPAVAYLRQGQGSGTMPIEYGEALIAFYEKRSDEALSKVAVAARRDPWPFEEYRLRARILQTQGRDRSQEGRFDDAMWLYGEAERAYLGALDIARAHAGIHEDICRLREAQIDTMVRIRKDLSAAVEDGIKALELAGRIDPGSSDLPLIEANIHWMWADSQLMRGADPVPELDKAVESVKKAMALRPGRASNYVALGDIYEVWGAYASLRGEDPKELVEKSIESYREAIRIDPSEVVYKSLGMVCDDKIQGVLEGWLDDPRDAFELAVESLRRAHELSPRWYDPLVTLAKTYRDWARYEILLGRDPRGSIRSAIQYATAALGMGKDENVWYQVGTAYQVETEYCLKAGLALEVPYRLAVESFDKAIRLRPNYHFAYTEFARTHLLRASAQLERGESPADPISASAQLLDRAVSLNPHYADAYFLMSEAQQLLAESDLQRGLVPEARGLRALEYSRHGLAINPRGAPGLLTGAAAWLLRARISGTGTAIGQARSLLHQGLDSFPMDHRFVVKWAESYVIEGCWQHRLGRSPVACFEAANAALKRANELNGNQADAHRVTAIMYLNWAEFLMRPARGIDVSRIIQAGLRSVDTGLLIHPDQPEMLAIRGALQCLCAQIEPGRDSRGDLFRKARQSLAKAAGLNPNMARIYQSYYSRIPRPGRVEP
ncbi:MAG: protein kinase [Acidobacteria bacterium]|nr:protein kinase [Acidobacteriota bacterium]